MSVSTIPARSVTAEQLVEVLAALRGAADAILQLHEPDSAVTAYFDDIAYRLQDEFFGKEHVDDDTWKADPIEVAIYAGAAEHEANALERMSPLADRILTLRKMGPRYRNIGSIDVQFRDFVKCDSCGTIHDGTAEGWSHAPGDGLEVFCPKCAAGEGVGDAS